MAKHWSQQSERFKVDLYFKRTFASLSGSFHRNTKGNKQELKGREKNLPSKSLKNTNVEHSTFSITP